MITLRAILASISFGTPSVTLHAKQETNQLFYQTMGLDEESVIIATVTPASAKNEPRRNTLYAPTNKGSTGYFSSSPDSIFHHLGIELKDTEFESLRQSSPQFLASSRALEVELSFDANPERDDEIARVWSLIGEGRVSFKPV